MRRLAAAVLLLAAGAVHAQPSEDPRRVIELPPAVAEQLRAEMRNHMDTLDELVGAVAMGEFDRAADIARTRMRMGHRLDERLRAAGYSDEEIREFREALREQGWAPGRGLRGEGPASGVAGGMGPGRFVPDDFRAMGQTFHQAAQEFAATAREVGNPPTVADYENVLAALQFVTSTCRSCHATYRLAR
jgi:hypothetical protein